MFSDRFNDSANTQRLPGYALVGLRSSYAWSRDISFTAEIQNALDKDYIVNRVSSAPFSDYGTAGRALYIGLRYAPK
jgi:vitamin B12 transporter